MVAHALEIQNSTQRIPEEGSPSLSWYPAAGLLRGVSIFFLRFSAFC